MASIITPAIGSDRQHATAARRSHLRRFATCGDICKINRCSDLFPSARAVTAVPPVSRIVTEIQIRTSRRLTHLKTARTLSFPSAGTNAWQTLGLHSCCGYHCRPDATELRSLNLHGLAAFPPIRRCCIRPRDSFHPTDVRCPGGSQPRPACRALPLFRRSRLPFVDTGS